MQRTVLGLLLTGVMVGMAGCTAERLPGDGSTVQLNAMPHGMETFHSLLIHEDQGHDELTKHEQAALDEKREAITQQVVNRLRETPYAHLLRIAERAVIQVDEDGQELTRRSVARAEVYMGHESVWTAGWICDEDGSFDVDYPTMKLFYEGGPVFERDLEHEEQHGEYALSVYSPWHPSGSYDITAMGSWYGCMIGDCSASWLGDSERPDFFKRRLGESQLLPGTRTVLGEEAYVMRWEIERLDEEHGDPLYRSRHDAYFTADGVYLGRDMQQWSAVDGRETLLIERAVNEWTFHDTQPAELDYFRAWLAKGLDDDAIAAAKAQMPVAGNQVPDVTLTMLGGMEQSVSELLTDGPIVLVFWSTRCETCVESMPYVLEAAHELAVEGVQVIAVGIYDLKENVRSHVREHEFNIPVAMVESRAVAERFEVRSVPQRLVIDADGVIRANEIGLPERFARAIRRTLEKDDSELVRH